MTQPTGTQSKALHRSLISLLVTFAVMALLLFVPAGTLDWPRGWAFEIAFTMACLIATVLLWRINPEIFVARSRVQPGTKRLDYVFIAVVMASFAAILPVAGLDFRFGWAEAPDWAVMLGYVLFAFGFAASMWPPAVNRHFEPGVRIQSDRGQTVIDFGPYAIVRHPGYSAAAILAVGMALSLGSWWALVPALIAIIALVPRTLFEERVLGAGLPGYLAYKERVKYRWVPGVW